MNFFLFLLVPLFGVANCGIWQPKPMTTWQWQLKKDINTSYNVQMYDIDLFDAPVETIKQLHKDGRIVICYFSAGSFEGWREDAKNFSKAVLGKQMKGWDEQWFDVRSNALKAPLKWRMELAKKKGCDGVEPDNMDAFAPGNDPGFPITALQQLSFNKWVAATAHQLGLSVGIKNDLTQLKQLVEDYDWALNEQCMALKECDVYSTSFIAKNKAVFGVEYDEMEPAEFCPLANKMKLSWLKKNHDSVDARRVDCQDPATWKVDLANLPGDDEGVDKATEEEIVSDE